MRRTGVWKILAAVCLTLAGPAVLAGIDLWVLDVLPILDRELEMGETMAIQAQFTPGGHSVTWYVSCSGSGSAQINSNGLVTYTAPTSGGGSATITVSAYSDTDPEFNYDSTTFHIYTRERIPSLGTVHVPTATPGQGQEPGGYLLVSGVNPVTGQLWQLYPTESGRLIAIQDAAGASPTIREVTSSGAAPWACDMAFDTTGKVVFVWAGVLDSNAVVRSVVWNGSSFEGPTTPFTVGPSSTCGIGVVTLACSPLTSGAARLAFSCWDGSGPVGIRTATHSGAWTAAWGTTSLISNSSAWNAPDLLIHRLPTGGERTVLAYQEDLGSGQYAVHVREWTGSAWDSPTSFDNGALASYDFGPCLASSPDGSHIWIAFLNYSSGNFELMAAERPGADWPSSTVTATRVRQGTYLWSGAPSLVVDNSGQVFAAVTSAKTTHMAQEEARPLVFHHNGASWTTWNPGGGVNTWTLANSQNSLTHHPAAEIAWVRSGGTAIYSSLARNPNGGVHLSWAHVEMGQTAWQIAHRMLDARAVANGGDPLTDNPAVSVASALAGSTVPARQMFIGGNVTGTPSWVSFASPASATLTSPASGQHSKELLVSYRYSGLTRATWPVRDTINLWLFNPAPDDFSVSHVPPGDEDLGLVVGYYDAQSPAEEITVRRAESILSETWSIPGDFDPSQGGAYEFEDTEAVDDEAPVAPEYGDPMSYPLPGLVTNQAVIVRWQPVEDVGGDWFYRFETTDDEATGRTVNLVENGSFEWDQAGTAAPPFPSAKWAYWTSESSVMTAQVVTDASSGAGQRCFRIGQDMSGADDVVAEMTHRIPSGIAPAGHWYRVQVRVKGVAAEITALTDPEGSQSTDEMGLVRRTTEESGSWQTVSFPVFLPEDRPQLSVRVRGLFGPYQELRIDDLRAEPILPAGYTIRPPARSVLANGDFEQDDVGVQSPSAWQVTGPITAEVMEDTVHAGEQALALMIDGEQDGFISTTASAASLDSQIVVARAWLRSPDELPVHLALWGGASGPTDLIAQSAILDTSSAWQELTLVAALDPNAVDLDLRLCVPGGQQATVWIDDAELLAGQAGVTRRSGLDGFQLTARYKPEGQTPQLYSGPLTLTADQTDCAFSLDVREEPYSILLATHDNAGNPGDDLVWASFDSSDVGYADACQPFQYAGVVVPGLTGDGFSFELERLRKLLWAERGGTVYFPPGRYLISERDGWADVPDGTAVPPGDPPPDPDTVWDPIQLVDVHLLGPGGASAGPSFPPDYVRGDTGAYLRRSYSQFGPGATFVLDFDPVVSQPQPENPASFQQGSDVLTLFGDGTIRTTAEVSNNHLEEFRPAPDAFHTDPPGRQNYPLFAGTPVQVFQVRGHVQLDGMSTMSLGRYLYQPQNRTGTGETYSWPRDSTDVYPVPSNAPVLSDVWRQNLTLFVARGNSTLHDAPEADSDLCLDGLQIIRPVWRVIETTPGRADLTVRNCSLQYMDIGVLLTAPNTGSVRVRSSVLTPWAQGMDYVAVLEEVHSGFGEWPVYDTNGDQITDPSQQLFSQLPTGRRRWNLSSSAFTFDSRAGTVSDFSAQSAFTIFAINSVQFLGAPSAPTEFTTNARFNGCYWDDIPMRYEGWANPEVLISGNYHAGGRGNVIDAGAGSAARTSTRPLIITGSTLDTFGADFYDNYLGSYPREDFWGESLVVRNWQMPLILSGNALRFREHDPERDNGSIGLLGTAGPSILHGNTFPDIPRAPGPTDPLDFEALDYPIDLSGSSNIVFSGNNAPSANLEGSRPSVNLSGVSRSVFTGNLTGAALDPGQVTDSVLWQNTP